MACCLNNYPLDDASRKILYATMSNVKIWHGPRLETIHCVPSILILNLRRHMICCSKSFSICQSKDFNFYSILLVLLHTQQGKKKRQIQPIGISKSLGYQNFFMVNLINNFFNYCQLGLYVTFRLNHITKNFNLLTKIILNFLSIYTNHPQLFHITNWVVCVNT